ncbi:hypothetical protein RHMOL_Rhmol07G0040000 [Rhododendron molle]|uniref:Uncharacterized protein n=1 Tax=Rhododendron molle TaxID=49168 RepID=A0ACC0MYS7_RHOML|nr:hypothetical protein RHMOL_Rhmol07G0040000 [Rhododendron molle]
MLFLFSNCDRINAKVDKNKHSSWLIVGSTIDEVGDVDEVVDDEFKYVDRMDPAEKYCKHAETRYLTEPWANLIEGVGQEFPKGVKEFRGVLARYAIENGFMYRLVKNDQLRVTAVCVIERCANHTASANDQLCVPFFHPAAVQEQNIQHIKEAKGIEHLITAGWQIT